MVRQIATSGVLMLIHVNTILVLIEYPSLLAFQRADKIPSPPPPVFELGKTRTNNVLRNQSID